MNERKVWLEVEKTLANKELTSVSIQKSINEDIRDMKRIGRNIKHMKGKRGYVGVMYDPCKDLTEKKIKKLYDGETRVYDMEKIIKMKEFKYLDKEMQKMYLESWRKVYSNVEIAQEMEVGVATLYSILKNLGVTDGKKGRKKKDKALQLKYKVIEPKENKEEQEQEQPKVETKKTKREKLIVQKEELVAVVNLNGKYKGEKLSSKLKALSLLVDDNEDYEFTIEIKK